MERSSIAHRTLKWSAWALAGLVALLAVLAAGLALVDATDFRGPVSRWLSARTGRDIRIEGPLTTRLLSFHPRLVAEQVSIGNPPWTPPGRTAAIGRLSIVFDLPLLGRPFAIEKLEIDSATWSLVRDPTGRANWQVADPTQKAGKGPPLIRSLSMLNAHITLDDGRRHIQFEGVVSAQDAPATGGIRPLQIEGSGHLNGRANTFALNGDPLATASHGQPYRFTFAERSSGSYLKGRGFLSRPFYMRALETNFEATGEDMKDMYFLTGFNLPDTAAYHLSGKLVRREMHFQIDMRATTGASDMYGTLGVDAVIGGRSKIDADLHSKLLRLSDIGARAAGKAAEEAPTAKPTLFPDKELRLAGLRRSDAVYNYHAKGVEVGKVSLHAVAAKLTIDHGVLSLTPLSAAFSEGKLTGSAKLDASEDIAAAAVDLKLTDLQLSQFAHQGAGEPPFEGPLRARVVLKGHGRSFHELASSANGIATAVLPHGEIRASLPELAGIDLRGVGLLLTKNKAETSVRCGVASFKVADGTLTTQSLVLDTEPVLITGDGTIDLESESVDLTLHGRPKHLRLFRLRAPVTVRGPLKHPKVGIEPGKTAAQAGAAVALGVVLTPLAAVLAFVDPGLTKDADCGALLAENKTEGRAATLEAK